MELSLFSKYDRLLVFDTETTGLSPQWNEIIQFSGVVLTPDGEEEVYDELIALPRGKTVPYEITRLTGITTEDLLERGIPKARFVEDFTRLIQGKTLLLAYNAQFDLSFLYYTLVKYGDPAILKGKDKLDILTVYRDRRPGYHKLSDAIIGYGLSEKCRNAHQALADTRAAQYVLEAMAEERDDLINYVNLFGYPARFGCPKKTIRSVCYLPQRSGTGTPLYKTTGGIDNDQSESL